VPLLGDIMRMPGLPVSPQAERMDLVDGEVRQTPGGPASASHAPA
jgi:formyltetrahydrofolate synthetase